MRFITLSRNAAYPSPRRLATAVLRANNWDDYGFKTLFELELLTSDGRLPIGGVKIARRGQTVGPHSLEGEFDALSDQYVSLGQDSTYYEVLARLDETERNEILMGLQDAVFIDGKAEEFQQEAFWRDSIVRFGDAENALETGRRVLEGKVVKRIKIPDLRFRTGDPVDSTKLDFVFSRDGLLTTRVNALIGYNGVGKTTLLSRLARVAHADNRTRANGEFIRSNGRLVGEVPKFSAIVMVSYSAFDTFELPGEATSESQELAERSDGEVFGYSYCGLRIASPPGEQDSASVLKSAEQQRSEFMRTIQDIARTGRTSVFNEILDPLRVEPSFAQADFLDRLLDGDTGDLGDGFASLSSGHKITLSIIAHLARRLQPRSLVLIDEPEAHLHPVLLATLVTSVSAILERYDSIAIVATHSPVVLQEIPSLCVHVLRWSGAKVASRPPATETYGENIGVITSDVFHLDGMAADHHRILDELAATLSIDEADAMFPDGLSLGARSYLLSQIARDR